MGFFGVIFILFFAVSLTVGLEVLLAVILKVRNAGDLGIIALINVVTNLILNTLIIVLGIEFDNFMYLYENLPFLYYCVIALFELIVFLVEATVYRRNLVTKINPYVLSLILNLVSGVLGTLIYNLIINFGNIF